MNIVDNSGKGLAALGRNEDRFMAHVAKGEMVVPPVISDKTKSLIKKEMQAVGLDPKEYEVGVGMSINPITGQPEFGRLKKTFKSVKKVVKKAAPVIGVASMFIPGLGPAVSGMLKAIPGVGGALSTGFNFMTGAGGAGTASKAATAGKGMFGGTLGPRIKSGLGSMFGGAGSQGTGQSKLGGIEDFFKMLGGDTGQSRTEELLAAGFTQEQIDAAKAAGTFDQLVAQARQGGSNNQGGIFSGGSGEGGFFGEGGRMAQFGDWMQQHHLGGLGNMFPGLSNFAASIPGFTNLPGISDIFSGQFSPTQAIGKLADRQGLGGIYKSAMGLLGGGDQYTGLKELAGELGVSPETLGAIDKGKSLYERAKSVALSTTRLEITLNNNKGNIIIS